MDETTEGAIAVILYELQRLLQPYPAKRMPLVPVSTLVNSPRNDKPECVAAVSA